MKQISFMAACMFSFASLSVLAQSHPQAVNYHQTAKTRFVDAVGTRYAYRILGNKTGIPLVLMHGSFFTMDNWDPTITNGLAKYYKVILFDNKGVGATDGKTPDNIAGMAADAVSFIEALGYNKVNLMGFSMGGMITQQILLTKPQLVNKVILSSTGSKGSDGLSELPKRIAEVSSLSPDDQLVHLFFASSATSEQSGKLWIARYNKRSINRDPEVTKESDGAQLTAVLGWAQPDADALDQLKTINQPVLIVDGRYDKLVPVTNSFNLFQSLPNARLYLYPNAGHGAIFQYPDDFVHKALEFLKEQ
ncbi:MAG: alpha/beta hydrolase [Bacteroidota bacterium]|nr:alpha/beta hydrolase [Bacteroidota bacterium]